MKVHRFIGEYDFSKKEVEITDVKIIKQIKAVLKLKKGEKVILSNGKGEEAEVTLDSIYDEKITGIIDTVQKAEKAKRKVNLYLAILKKENFELAVQKTVEAGVHRIIPIITERTIKTGLNFSRLEKIMIEASEQSGRGVVPILSTIMKFKEALIDGAGSQPARNASSVADARPHDSQQRVGQAGGEKIIFTPFFVKNGVSSKSECYEPDKNAENISIFIGPEGGFTEKEIKEATEAGYTPASLGSLVLRGETAAIIATYRTSKGI
ncbi:MAG: RsmE family RNA methyltransferase [Candidatus Nomurabacteria bacterium]|nr:RsmE family RNA methyltransferase [Candidatus Nomurabacteria bacterium]